jgi:hypothetical protein
MMIRMPLVSVLRTVFALGLLIATCRGQYEIKRGTLNQLFVSVSAVPGAGSPTITTPQFRAIEVTSAASSARTTSGALSAQYPAAIYRTSYPSGTATGAAAVLVRSQFGSAFASGVPRYLFADVISPPLAQEGGSTPAPAGYWRPWPVVPGETFSQPGSGSAGAPARLVSITVVSGGGGYNAASPPAVTITGGGGAGAIAQAVVSGSGVVTSVNVVNSGYGFTSAPTVTIAAGGGAAAAATAVMEDLAPSGTAASVYYSPHAEKVFASQAGRVAITWVTAAPQNVPGTAVQRYLFRQEVFNVSSASALRPRVMYWTEKEYTAPPVSLPAALVQLALPAYNANFPALVGSDYSFGYLDPKTGELVVNRTAASEERRTLWYQNNSGVAELRAYNMEGRILVEYLGPLKPGAVNQREFLGADVIDVVRVMPSIAATVELGDRIVPKDSAGGSLLGDGLKEWLAAPVTTINRDNVVYYSNVVRPDGRRDYYAERENLDPDRVTFYWLESNSSAITPPSGSGVSAPTIFWPVLKNSYYQVWPSGLSSYVHYLVPVGGSGVSTGIQLSAGKIPQVVYQDDGAQTEARVDVGSQRLVVGVPNDGYNRALLKFSDESRVWYVRLYSQDVTRSAFVEPDGAALTGNAVVGQRIEAPPGYSSAGYIFSGTNYHPASYLNPSQAGVTAAARGAIIPVNARPSDRVLKVWWYREVASPGGNFGSFFVPSKQGVYTVSFPASAPEIVLASNRGSGPLGASESAGSLYFENDIAKVGYNPNEEHAVISGGQVYALRDDLNNTTQSTAYTSAPFVLLSYASPDDGRPAMSAFRVLRTNASHSFDYTIEAGTRLQPPLPIALLPLALDPSSKESKNREVVQAAGGDASQLNSGLSLEVKAAYGKFTFKDRQGYDWVFRGPHTNGQTPSFGMQFWYPMRPGFFVPGVSPQPAEGTPLPFLRPVASGSTYAGDPVTGDPITIIYRPAWPALAPAIRVAETLTLPKYGLPAVHGQTSVQVIYQQSHAKTTRESVVLHDPFREKTVALGSSVGLTKLPASIATVSDNGKTYFQRLPPHLQRRIFFDPMRGPSGTLIISGQLVEEPLGESFVHLNVVSSADRTALLDLCSQSDADFAGWSSAVDALASSVETFRPDPANPSVYKAQAGLTRTVGAGQLAVVEDPETAVVNYALTATGQGSGWVTLVVGGGKAFTPASEPVDLQVFQVLPELYAGETKVLFPENPLDEQVTLRHTGDFAGRPQDYIFEWRYAQPAASGLAPPIYSYVMSSRLAWSGWKQIQNPGVARPTDAAYAAAPSVSLARQLAIRDVNYVATGATPPPGVALKGPDVDFSAGVPVRVIASAQLDARSGFDLYVNNMLAVTFRQPAVTGSAFSSTLLTPNDGGLGLQFEVPTRFFRVGLNRIEVNLFTTASAGTLSTVDFRLHAAQEADKVVEPGSPWFKPDGTLSNVVTVGGSPSNPLSSPLLSLGDNYFTMRYRPNSGANGVAHAETWSRWSEPKLVEGFIKRALAGINPFNQRVKNFGSASIDSDVSVLTEAGKRWEGNVALSLANINNFGLIEIYETLLNRARKISIDSGYDVAAANDALLLATGYLNDLYVVLGNEAFADAANSTIAVDQGSTSASVNTSRFAFEGQVANVLDEELALLRGRDDLLAPGVRIAPVYNRLVWNYTRGINSGEALYALNYNIREPVSGTSANGTVDAADAQWMFPQGHGDAYGHYLTALKGYYRLLQSPSFSWSPRAETVSVLGQPVSVDYYDERRFADSAAFVTRAAQQILTLSYRQSYRDNAALGWGHLRDGKYNSSTGVTRNWGVDEWAARAAHGAYFHWLTANSLLPERDTDPGKSGIQIVDRTTVASLGELAVSGAALQAALDSANARLNPLGLSPGAIAFDISPTELKAGKSHFEQIYERALQAALNAKGAFDQASRMSAMLRGQELQSTDSLLRVDEQEAAYKRQLVEVFGKPYSGEVGAGRMYPQGYDGPDTIAWFLIDRPGGGLIDTSESVDLQIRVPLEFKVFGEFSVDDIKASYDSTTESVSRTVSIRPHRLVQYADDWSKKFGYALGSRPVAGRLQESMLSAGLAQVELLAAVDRFRIKDQNFKRSHQLVQEMVSVNAASDSYEKAALDRMNLFRKISTGLNITASVTEAAADLIEGSMEGVADGIARVLGFSNDMLAPVSGFINVNGALISNILKIVGVAASSSALGVDGERERVGENLDYDLRQITGSYEDAQVAYEFELKYREVLNSHYEVAQCAIRLQKALQSIDSALAEGNRLIAERTLFRQRAAAVVQGYRTRDVVFRTFRNEALEQYRTLFDLASRYTYLATKSYDYETGLLGSSTGQGLLDSIVAARSLGDLTGNIPRATAGSQGDAGLAGAMAKLQSDWSVAKSRLGINNPDQNGTVFSLRRELFRIRDDPAITSDDTIWRQTLEQNFVPNLLTDPDVALMCRNLQKPDGTSVPGIILSFRTAIQHGQNFFGLSLAEGDHAFSASNFSTKIYSVGVVLSGYVGIDPNLNGSATSPVVFGTTPNALSATPYIYLIPTGTDFMRAPPLGDTDEIRGWQVADQALPLPYNLGATKFSSSQYVYANGSLMEVPWVTRRHNAFRAVSEPSFFYSSVPAEFTSSRLVGRSVWNSSWKLVIPAYTLHSNEQEGLNRFAASVSDIKLFLRTYSNAGN